MANNNNIQSAGSVHINSVVSYDYFSKREGKHILRRFKITGFDLVRPDYFTAGVIDLDDGDAQKIRSLRFENIVDIEN